MGGNPFKRVGKFFKKVGSQIYGEVGRIPHNVGRLGGNDKYGNYSAWGMAPSAASADIESQKAQADAEAAAKQAEFEATQREGLERLALKRKKGFGASMIVNPTLGSTSTLGS